MLGKIQALSHQPRKSMETMVGWTSEKQSFELQKSKLPECGKQPQFGYKVARAEC
jgi:hypothetical protein